MANDIMGFIAGVGVALLVIGCRFYGKSFYEAIFNDGYYAAKDYYSDWEKWWHAGFDAGWDGALKQKERMERGSIKCP